MHFSLLPLTLTVLISAPGAYSLPVTNGTSSSIKTHLTTRDMQPFYSFTGGRIPDARTAKAAAKVWKDPYGPVPQGSFSVVMENGQVNVFAQAIGPLAPRTGYFATSQKLCKKGMPTTTQHGTNLWIDAKAIALVYYPLYAHAGNQCALELPGYQFDNAWLSFRGTFVNLPNDGRCEDVESFLPPIVRARRCVIKL